MNHSGILKLIMKNQFHLNWQIGKNLLVTGIEKPLINKDSTIYKLKSDTTMWSITILPQFCNDGMSDYLYQYKVNVKYNGILYKGCGVMLSKKNSQ